MVKMSAREVLIFGKRINRKVGHDVVTMEDLIYRSNQLNENLWVIQCKEYSTTLWVWVQNNEKGELDVKKVKEIQ